MMRWIVGASLQSRLLVAAMAVGLIYFGITNLPKMPVDTLPEFSQPYVEIQTEAQGLSAPEVEALITVPMEADMLNGTPWVQEIRSESIPGLSSIVLLFEPGTNVMRARQMVTEHLTQVYALPNVGKPPVILNPVSSASRVMMIGLSSDTISPIDMSVLARWTIVPRLSGVSGVANVSIWGERRRQLQVQVDPKRLAESKITLQQIINTAGNALWFSPLTYLSASTPGASGFIDTPNQRLNVRHLLPITTPEEFAQVTVDGTEKHLGDVAKVVQDHQPLIGDAIVNGKPSLTLVVEKLPGAKTLEVTRGVEKALAAMKPGLAGVKVDPTLFRPATYIEASISNLKTAVLIGAGLLVVALAAFFVDARATLVSALSILLSFTAAVAVLYLSGVTLNAMILAGLVMALGVVIDDAVIDVESIAHRLREHRRTASDKSFARVVLEASLELREPLLYATAILLLIAAPAFFLSGVTGTFLQSIAIGFALAVIASMLVALVATTALGVMLLPGCPLEGRRSAIVEQIQYTYSGVLLRLVENPRPAFALVCVVALISFGILLSNKRVSTLPEFKDRDLHVEVEGAPGTSHPAMTRFITQATQELSGIPGIRTVSAQIGRAALSDRVHDVNKSSLWISLEGNADYHATVDRIHQVVDGFAGFEVDARTYLKACVTDPNDDVSGDGDDDIVVRVYGDDWKLLKSKADEVQKALAGISGIVRPEVELSPEGPQIDIKVKMAAAKQHGLKPGDVRRAATTLIAGLEVGYLFEHQKVFDVVVWGTPENRDSLTKIQSLLIDAPGGKQVRLQDVADVQIAPSPIDIKREAVARHIDVVANVEGREATSVASDVERRLRDIDFPQEYRAELKHGAAERLAERRHVLSAVIATAIAIFLVLQACTGSWKLATALFLTLPAAIVGGAIAALATTGAWSLGAALGIVAVLAIALRNGLSLIRQYQRLALPPEQTDADSVVQSRSVDQRSRIERTVADDDAIFAPGIVQRGTWDRFVPILMTAAITAVAILPMAVMGDVAGNEILHSMAITVLGGLATTTLFTLFAVPALFLTFTPGRGPELEDLGVELVGEKEFSESIAPARVAEKELQSARVNS
jgi:Cu/Ag efflux pump CusA